MSDECPICGEQYIVRIEKFKGNFTTHNDNFRFCQRWGKDYYLHSENNLDNKLHSKIDDLDEEEKKEMIN